MHTSRATRVWMVGGLTSDVRPNVVWFCLLWIDWHIVFVVVVDFTFVVVVNQFN